MGTPKVSILIPVYNAAEFLEESLGGVINQTLRDIEIIIVDDGSTDESPEILRRFAEHDKRIQVYHQDNAGGGVARENALKKAKGDYVLFLDADDIFEPELASHTYEKAIECDADIVAFETWVQDLQTGIKRNAHWMLVHDLLPQKEVFSREDIPDSILQFSFTTLWNKLYKRSFLAEKKISFHDIRVTDTVLFTSIALAEASRITCLTEKLICYRSNNDSSQRGSLSKYPTVVCDAIHGIYDELIERGLFEAIKRSFINKAVDYCLSYLGSIKDGNAFETLYYKLAETTFPKLKINTFGEEYFFNKYSFMKANDILNLSPAAFLFNHLQDTKTKSIPVPYHLPSERIPFGSRVVLYGAGDAGRSCFIQNLASDEYNIVMWADKAYAQKGYPVVSPSIIGEEPYDYLVVAILDRAVAESVANTLAKNGVPRQKIIFIEG